MGERRRRPVPEREEGQSPRRPRLTPEATAEDHEHPLAGLQEQLGNRAITALVTDEGRSLTPGERQPMEGSFQRGFEEVRVHEGAAVDEVAARMGATAFAAGSDVYLAAQAPDTSTPAGKLVLGEELAHVAQGVGSAGAQRVLPAGDRVEAEAHTAASAAAAGERATVSPAGSAVSATGRWDPVEAVRSFFGGEEEEVTELRDGPGAVTPIDVTVTQGMSAEEYNRMSAGTLPKLEAAKTKFLAKNGQEGAALPLLEDAYGLLGEFTDHEQAGFTAKLARNDINAASLIAESISDPTHAMATLAASLTSAKATVAGAVGSARNEVADPATGVTPERTTLTTAEGQQLSAAALIPMDRAIAKIESGDYQGASDALLGVANVLNSFVSAPTPIVEALAKASRAVEGVCDVLDAQSGSVNDKCDKAAAQIDGAIGAINGIAPPPPPT